MGRRGESEVARALAESFLARPPELPGLEIASCYEPAATLELIGGDFLDFLPLSPRRLGLALGDLCGHGLQAATQVARVKYMLRAYAVEELSPARVLARLNRALCREGLGDCPFLTLVYGVVDLDARTFTYANAGHLPPLLLRPGASRCTPLPPTGSLLAVDERASYQQGSVLLEPGALLLCLTDGLTEARPETGENGPFGAERVGALLVERRNRPAAELVAAILEGARAFAGGVLRDDAALVLLRCR